MTYAHDGYAMHCTFPDLLKFGPAGCDFGIKSIRGKDLGATRGFFIPVGMLELFQASAFFLRALVHTDILPCDRRMATALTPSSALAWHPRVSPRGWGQPDI